MRIAVEQTIYREARGGIGNPLCDLLAGDSETLEPIGNLLSHAPAKELRVRILECAGYRSEKVRGFTLERGPADYAHGARDISRIQPRNEPGDKAAQRGLAGSTRAGHCHELAGPHTK